MRFKPGMTKDEEIRLLSNFIQSLPGDCYLRDYLEHSVPQFEQMIRSDIVEPLAVSILEARRELDTLSKEILAAQAKKEEHERRAREALLSLQQTQNKLRNIAALADDINTKAEQIRAQADRCSG